MNQSIAVKVGLWLSIVFILVGIFGWDLLNDMKHLNMETNIIEDNNNKSHDLHRLEISLRHCIDPVKKFLITGDYRLKAYFLQIHKSLLIDIKKYEKKYSNDALKGTVTTLSQIKTISAEIFNLPYAVGNMEGPIILQEIEGKIKFSIQHLSEQHHTLDIQVNNAMRMMAGLRVDIRNEALALLAVLLIILLLLTYFIYSQIVSPLIRMRKAVQQVSKGNFSERCNITSNDEIGELAQAFNLMGHELEERDKKLSHTRSLAAYQDKMSALGLMSAGIAHEVGNPLAAISVSLQVAQKKLTLHDTDAVQSQLQITLKETARMESIIQVILNFGRRESTPVMKNFHLFPVIKEAVQLAQMAPRKNNVHISFDIALSLPELYAEEGMLLQVLLNLILNSLDACNDGGNIDISAFEKTDKKLIIHIKDSGHGIADSIKDDIFNPDFTSKARGEGSGIGLAISRELINSMHGSLELIHSDTIGSCFQICLPIKEDL